MTAPTPEAAALWRDDTGTLAEPSRRALVEVLKGPYLTARRHPQLWSALIADESAIAPRSSRQAGIFPRGLIALYSALTLNGMTGS